MNSNHKNVVPSSRLITFHPTFKHVKNYIKVSYHCLLCDNEDVTFEPRIKHFKSVCVQCYATLFIVQSKRKVEWAILTDILTWYNLEFVSAVNAKRCSWGQVEFLPTYKKLTFLFLSLLLEKI